MRVTSASKKWCSGCAGWDDAERGSVAGAFGWRKDEKRLW